MSKLLRKSVIVILAITAMLTFYMGIVGFGSKKVLASEIEDISVDKASVYINNAGIRYLVSIDKTTFESLEETDEIGVFLAPTSNLGSNELNIDSYVKTGVFNERNDFKLDEETQRYQAYFYVYNIPESNNGDDVSVRAYIKKGENYSYAKTKSCSIAYVAYEASKIDEENAQAILNRYCVGYYNLGYTVNYTCGDVTVKTETKHCKYGLTPFEIEAGRFLTEEKVNYSFDGKVFENALTEENCVFDIPCVEIDPITYADGVYTVKGSDLVNDETYYEFINTTPLTSFEVEATFKPDGVNTDGSISGTGMSFAVKQGEHSINFLMVTNTGFYCVVDGEDYNDQAGWDKVKVPGATGAKVIATTNAVTLKMTYNSNVGFTFYQKSGENWIAMSTSFTLSQVNELCSVDYFDNNVGIECGIATRVGQGGAYGSNLSFGGTVSNYTYTELVEYTLNMVCGEQTIDTKTLAGKVGDTVTSPSIYQKDGVIYNLDGTASLVLSNESNLLNASYTKNFAVSDLDFVDKFFHAYNTGAFSQNDTWATHANYINVKAGDKISGTSIQNLMVHEYNTETNTLVAAALYSSGGTSYMFTKDCAVIISIKKGNGLSVEEAFNGLKFEITANNFALCNLKEISVADFEWSNNTQIGNNGVAGESTNFYGTKKYIKVKAGDVVVFDCAVRTKYSLAEYDVNKVHVPIAGATNYFWFSDGNPHAVTVRQDGYVRVSIRKRFDDASTLLTEEQAKQAIKIYSTAYNKIDADTLGWKVGQVVANGTIDDNVLYYSTANFIKVKAGDSITFNAGTKYIVARYSDKSYNSYISQSFNTVSPYTEVFTEDCYIRISIRRHFDSNTDTAVTLEQAKQLVNIYTSAVQD